MNNATKPEATETGTIVHLDRERYINDSFAHPEAPRTSAERLAQRAANAEFLHEALDLLETRGDAAGAARIRLALELLGD